MSLNKMTGPERRSIFSLSLIMALRMLGLFMVLPLFSLYAEQLSGATPLLIGLGVGIYGLTQAFLQIPFGALSDFFGRKKIITLGLSIFIVGSILAAMSHTIGSLLLGRALQGAGAIGSTLMAFISDVTRTTQRTKAMAIAGITIGLSFMLAMMLGPLLAVKISVSSIFWCGALMSGIAIILLYTVVPPEPWIEPRPKKTGFWRQWLQLWSHPALLCLNMGIFLLHAIFTASFVVIPIALQTRTHLNQDSQWVLYLPILLGAFLFSIGGITIAEKKARVKALFCGSILILGLAEFLFWEWSENLLLSAFSLLLFFTAFSLLEAFLPSLVSKTAPQESKGAALGIYSFSQFFGIFIGGITGGFIYGRFGLMQVNLFCSILALIWLGIAFKMKNPQYSTTSTS